MFSGIIETTSSIISIEKKGSNYQLRVMRPEFFDDLKIGDSIAVNGVCLTVEVIEDKTLEFAVGPETLKITNWDKTLQENLPLNLERSLRFGDRIHGHLVTGHVDALGKVTDVISQDGALFFTVQIPEKFKKYVWKKGSLCIAGVSLTVNEVENDLVSFCLIPETLKKTNLRNMKVGDNINLEFDYMAKAAIHYQEMRV